MAFHRNMFVVKVSGGPPLELIIAGFSFDLTYPHFALGICCKISLLFINLLFLEFWIQAKETMESPQA